MGDGPMQGALHEVAGELASAVVRFAPLNSEHEGYAVILEELDELWDEIKADKVGRLDPVAWRLRMRKEAMQVAAMALRFALDRCPDDGGGS